MTYSVRVTFQEFSDTGVRRGKCPVCGKRGQRTNQFTMTQNPWNKNRETGAPRTLQEIRYELRKQAHEWSRGDFIHAKCESKEQTSE
jgi:hypothetical protein